MFFNIYHLYIIFKYILITCLKYNVFKIEKIYLFDTYIVDSNHVPGKL